MLKDVSLVLTLERYEVVAVTNTGHSMNVARLGRQNSQFLSNFGFASLRCLRIMPEDSRYQTAEYTLSPAP